MRVLAREIHSYVLTLSSPPSPCATWVFSYTASGSSAGMCTFGGRAGMTGVFS